MFANQEPLQRAGRDNLEAVMMAAGTQLDTMQRLAALSMEAFRGGFQAWTNQVRALAGAKDAQELLQLQASFFQPSLQSSVDYWQRVYGLASEAQGQLARITERRLAETSSCVSAALEEVSRSTTGVLAKAKKTA
jgi:phasin family protein